MMTALTCAMIAFAVGAILFPYMDWRMPLYLQGGMPRGAALAPLKPLWVVFGSVAGAVIGGMIGRSSAPRLSA